MNTRRIKKLLYLIISVIILVFLVFNDNGVVRYLNMKDDISKLHHSIKKADEELDSLRSEIDSLKNSLYKIEKVARERYHMLGKHEQAIKVEKKQIN